MRTNRSDSNAILGFSLRLIAAALVLVGLYLVVFGNSWGPRAFELLPASEFGSWLQLIVPFLPMVFIGLGAILFARCRQ